MKIAKIVGINKLKTQTEREANKMGGCAKPAKLNTHKEIDSRMANLPRNKEGEIVTHK